jgi:hypothetical protein
VPFGQLVDASLPGDLRCHVLTPLAGVAEETVGIVDLGAGVCLIAMFSSSAARDGYVLAGGGHGRRDAGDVPAGQQAVPVQPREHELCRDG